MQLTDLIILLIFAVAVAFYVVFNWIKRIKIESKLKLLKGKKLKAYRILEENGYKILDIDRTIKLEILTNDKVYTDSVSVDFVAKKGFSLFLVNTISGKNNPKFGQIATRRLYTGLFLLFRVSNLILIDLENGKLKSVKLKVKGSLKQKIRHVCMLSFVFLLGVVFSLIIWWFIF